MKRAFIDPVTGVLKAWGYAAGNEPGDVALDVPEQFALEPGRWRWDGKTWVAFTPPPKPQQLTPSELALVKWVSQKLNLNPLTAVSEALTLLQQEVSNVTATTQTQP
jgi:hypothetical protein